MQRMGVEEDEPLENKMISKSILNMQKKLEKKVITEHTTTSMEEWFERNVPPGRTIFYLRCNSTAYVCTHINQLCQHYFLPLL
jgi:hypothetical protein